MRIFLYYRYKTITLALMLLLGIVGLGTGVLAAGISPFGDDPIDVQGGQFDYVKKQNAVVIRGYATLVTGKTTIKARNMVYFRDTKEVYAQGDVAMQEPGGSIFYCESLYYNINENRGEANQVRVMGQDATKTAPTVTNVDSALYGPYANSSTWDSKNGLPFNRMFIRAEKVRSLSADTQQLFNTSLTTDNSPSPIFKITSKVAQLKRNEKVESWHNVLWIGHVPVFYLPYVLKDLRYDWPWMQVGAGHSNDWGSYALSRWGMDLKSDDDSYFRPEKLFLDLDWRQRRGWATGLDMKYEIGHRASYGLIDTYYLKESNTTRSDDEERARDDTEFGDSYRNDERWKIEWSHYQDLGNGWDLRGEINAYSDRDFLYEYFKKEFNEDKEPESVVDLRKLEDTYVFELVTKFRVNDFMTQEVYLPEARFTLPGYKLGDSNYYVRNDTRIGLIGKRFDNKADDQELFANFEVDEGRSKIDTFFRAHTDTRVYRPFKLGKVATFTPYVGGMATFYEDRLDTDNGNVRIAGLYGAEITGRFYGEYKNGKVRHIIEPSISFDAQEDPTLSHKSLYAVDEIDLYNELHSFTFKINNKIQTKRMVMPADGTGVAQERIVDLIDFDISTSYIPLEGEADEFNYGNRWTQLDFDLVYRPTDTLSLYGDLSWDLDNHYATDGSLGMDWKFENHFRTHITHRFRRGDSAIDQYADKSNETTFALRWMASDKYTVEWALIYEWANSTDQVDSGMSKQRLSFIRNLKVFELTLSYLRDTRRNDNSFYLTLSPIGIPPLERAGTDAPLAMPLMDSRYHPSTVEDVGMP